MPGARPVRLAVVGQGYVGLPLAARAVETGYDVIGFDTDKSRVDLLKRGKTFIEDVTAAQLATMLATGRYQPTTDPSALAGSTSRSSRCPPRSATAHRT